MKKTSLSLTLMQAGYCTGPEFIIMRGGKRQAVKIPALFALLEHPRQGAILFDTGYSPHFFQETSRWPYSLYKRLIPAYLDATDSAARQLKRKGIKPEEIKTIIISHFHGDHIAGLPDFPNARFIYFDEAYKAVQHLTGFSALRAGFLPGLIPDDFEQRSDPVAGSHFIVLSTEYAPFFHGVDLLGDGTLLAVLLPGHAHGQMGLFFQAEGVGPVFLAADACWHSRAYRELLFPNPVVNLLLPDAGGYRDTLLKLHRLHQNRPNLHIIPSHCPQAFASFGTIVKAPSL